MNPATCIFENGKYVGSFIDDSVVICNKIIKEKKNCSTKNLKETESWKYIITMERNDELKETDIKCHYFDDIIKKKKSSW